MTARTKRKAREIVFHRTTAVRHGFVSLWEECNAAHRDDEGEECIDLQHAAFLPAKRSGKRKVKRGTP